MNVKGGTRESASFSFPFITLQTAEGGIERQKPTLR